MDRIYEFLVTLLLFLVPAITTRLFSEERHLGTIELLLTAPLRDWELVLGKWLGAFMLLVTIVSLTIIYPLILNQIIEPGIDQGSLISQFLGLMLIIGMMIAIGVALSSLFTNQVATFIVTLFTFIFLWVVLAWVTQVMGQFSGGSGWLKYLNIQEPFSSNLVRGIIDLKDVVFYLSITALALFLATMSIEIRRWR